MSAMQQNKIVKDVLRIAASNAARIDAHDRQRGTPNTHALPIAAST